MEVPNPIFDEYWLPISDLIARIRDFTRDGQRISIIPTVAGCSYGLAGAIGSVVGTSGTLPMSIVSNDMDVTRQLTQFEITGGFCEPEVADALAAHGFYSFGAAKGPSVPLTSIFGIGVTGAIASRDPKAGARGGHRVFISLKTSANTHGVGIKFRHGSELDVQDQNALRRYQSQVADLAALNLIASALELPQFFLPKTTFIESVILGDEQIALHEKPHPGDGVGLKVTAVMRGPSAIEAGEQASLFDAQGNKQPLSYLKPGRHVLLPSNANPFTPGHDAMALEVKKLKVPGRGELTPVFTLTAANAEKGKVGNEEILARARQFSGRWPVLLLHDERMQYFVQMAERFKCDFAVGGDTPTRIFRPKYCAEYGGPQGVYAELKAMGVKFYVFPRADEYGRMSDVASIPSFARDESLFVPVPHFLNPWSSTQARAAQGSK